MKPVRFRSYRQRKLLRLSHVQRAGFTLVEMLVSVALVLLIMTMFAQIFQMAAGSITTQQGIAENDQQARMITSLIRGDLQRRSMRTVMPFESGEDTRLIPSELLQDRQGYFYIAENDPHDDTDDVLQFTTLVNLRSTSAEAASYSGRADSGPILAGASRVNITGIATSGTTSGNPEFEAASVGGLSIGNSIWVIGSDSGVNDGMYRILSITGLQIAVSPPIRDPSVTTFGQIARATEPEFDDGIPDNELGASSAAEVSYFLRGGTLYRRVLLIRDAATVEQAQPHFMNGTRLITGNYAGQFWKDYDYSAFHFPGKTTMSGTIGEGLWFHGTGPSLYNGSDGPLLILNDNTTPLTTFPFSLGIPNFRFGHDRDSGQPREFINSGAFIGRFLIQETASANFGYPGFMPAQNPFSRTLTMASGSNVIAEFDTTTERRGDDIVLPNCLVFDVKAFDPLTNQFSDIGSSTEDDNGNGTLDANEDRNGNGVLDIGVFHSTRVLNSNYSPVNQFKFDTWHPSASVGSGAPAVNPPFLPQDSENHTLPLTAIQIRIVYQSRTDGRLRQVTIVQSLQDQSRHADH